MLRSKLLVSALAAGCLFAFAGPAAAQDSGIIKGKAIFKGNAGNFKRKRINTGKDPNCKKAKPKGIGTDTIIINKKTTPMTLRNVMVYVKEGLGDRKFEAPTTPFILDQVGCQYVPHVIAIMDGQPLRVRNSDPTNHNIHLLPRINAEMNFSQPKQGMKRDLTLVKEGVFKAKCDVHPWMGCFIKVFDHPFHAVTDKTGTFEITGLPPGKYVVEAWHEKFGIQTMTIEVASGDTKEADFTFEPGK